MAPRHVEYMNDGIRVIPGGALYSLNDAVCSKTGKVRKVGFRRDSDDNGNVDVETWKVFIFILSIAVQQQLCIEFAGSFCFLVVVL